MRLFSVFALATLFAQAPAPLFEIELSPGEGRPQFQAMTSELALRETPSTEAAVVRRIRVIGGQDIAFDESRYRTLAAGRVEIQATTFLSGRILGGLRQLSREDYYNGEFPSRNLDLKAGDVVEYLQYRAEGTCFMRVAGAVIDADPCPTEDDSTFLVVTPPRTEWWIRVVVEGVPAGWIMVDDKAIKESGREF